MFASQSISQSAHMFFNRANQHSLLVFLVGLMGTAVYCISIDLCALDQ